MKPKEALLTVRFIGPELRTPLWFVRCLPVRLTQMERHPMNKENALVAFEKQAIRRFYDEKNEMWYFSVRSVDKTK
jgi:hypothetical protein